MPNYLWGESVRHSTYLINRISTRALDGQTPYEALKGRKPNINHLRIFGCLCYAKVEKIKLRKLDDISRVLVHLGTEPGSKAYRLLDPTTKSIKVSRDVVFDETKGWKWKRIDPEPTNYNDLSVKLGEYGNHGISETAESPLSRDTTVVTEEAVKPEAKITDVVEVEDDEIEVDHEDQGDDSETMILRRSERQTSRPKYLDDYVMLSEEESEMLLMCLNGEPRTFEEASELKEWI